MNKTVFRVVQADKSVLGRMYNIFGSGGLVVVGEVRYLKLEETLRRFEQPAHLYRSDAIALVKRLNSDPEYAEDLRRNVK